MALQGSREGLVRGVAERRARVGSRECGVGQDCSSTGIEAGNRAEFPGLVAYRLCIGILVHDLHNVGFLGLLYRLVVDAGALIGCAGKRVVGDDRLDDRVERRHICNRGRELADR